MPTPTFCPPSLPSRPRSRHPRTSPRRRRRRRPPIPHIQCSNTPISDDTFLQHITSRRPDARLLSIVESCVGAPFTFRGRRLYLLDLDACECDVLESPITDLPSPNLLAPFLPTNFPSSVSPGYAQWVLWHVARQLFRSAYYVLGTTSLLYSLGLGTGHALAVGATLQWVLKDGLGMGTKLLVSTRLAAVVDTDPRRWRFIGDTLMAVAAGVEILSVTNPPYFLLFGTTAALLKEAASAMSGPSYRVFLDSFAINSNIGDVSSRGEAQVVVGNLTGLGVGVAIASFLGALDGSDRLLSTLAFYAVLALGHLTCTFNGVQTVQLRTLNWQRLHLIIDDFLKRKSVPSVAEVNAKERFVYTGRPPPGKRIRLGAQLLDFVECGKDVSQALGHRKDRCIVAYNRGGAGVIIREDARPTDVLRAILQARKLVDSVDGISGRELDRELVGVLTRESYDWGGEVMPEFLWGLEKQGWSTTKLLMNMGESRYRESPALG